MRSCLRRRCHADIHDGAPLSNPNLILLDINMPGGSGIEVLKRLRVSNRTQQIPVIVISSEQNPATESMARELGAVDFLHKPVDEKILANAVDHVLGIQNNAQ